MADINEDRDVKWIVVMAIFAVAAIWFTGFFVGRKTVKDPKPKVVTEYVKGETVHDTIVKPKPYAVKVPVDTADIIRQCVRDGIYAELFPVKIVTKYIEVTREDTTVIMKDWATKRSYKEVLFDSDTAGSCDVTIEVQYNRIKGIGYNYKPVYKTVTVTKTERKFFSPFVGVGLVVSPHSGAVDLGGSIQAGAFFKDRGGVYLQYSRLAGTNRDVFGLGGTCKF